MVGASDLEVLLPCVFSHVLVAWSLGRDEGVSEEFPGSIIGEFEGSRSLPFLLDILSASARELFERVDDASSPFNTDAAQEE